MKMNSVAFGVSILLVTAGFFIPFWPLCVVGVLLLGATSHRILALMTGVLLDLAYGVPTGIFHIILFPFTILAIIAMLFPVLSKQYLLGGEQTLR
jgi:hypothetical protein